MTGNEAGRGATAVSGCPALSVDRLDFGYAGRPLFAGFELEIPAGEYLAIIGPNGAGKSTLLRLLAGFLVPGAGQVRIAGRDIRGIGRLELARLVAVVPQESHFVFGHTIEEVVMMGRHPWLGRFRMPGPEDHARVEEALALMDLGPMRQARVDEVSGGERQRTVIARALAQDAPVLLLDEPGAHLDLNHLARLFELLAELGSRGRTAVLVTHDINLAAAGCRRLLVLKEGRAAAVGPPREVLTAGLIRSVYGLEPALIRHPQSGRPVVLLPQDASPGSAAARPEDNCPEDR